MATCLADNERANESQRRASAEEDLVRAVAKAFELEATRADLEAVLEQIKALEEAIGVIEERLTQLPDVDQAAVEELETLDRQLEVGQGKLAATATRVQVLRASVAVKIGRAHV